MSNRGVAPYDITSDIGALRANVGDTQYVDLSPAETFYGNYAYFSDDELATFLNAGGQSLTRATGYAYRALASILTMLAVNITTDDLKNETLGRAKAMRDLANDWIRDAEAEDERAAAESFGIITFAGLEDTLYNQHREFI